MLTILMSLLVMGAEKAPLSYVQKNLSVECKGTGPSISIARSEALAECNKSAISYLQTEIKTKTLTVQTETDAALHEEIKSSLEIKGLECLDPKESMEEQDGSIKLNLKCHFDLTKVTVKEAESGAQEGDVKNSVEPRETYSEKGKKFSKQKTSLALTVIPQCTSLLIEGVSPRIIRCKNNPVLLVIDKEDRKIIVRANGYKPKEILQSEFGGKRELQVILNP